MNLPRKELANVIVVKLDAVEKVEHDCGMARDVSRWGARGGEDGALG
jgi:hypothetical protein